MHFMTHVMTGSPYSLLASLASLFLLVLVLLGCFVPLELLLFLLALRRFLLSLLSLCLFNLLGSPELRTGSGGALLRRR
jgi:Na+/H+ antiporter NhaC